MRREIWIPLTMALGSALLFASATPVSKVLLAKSDPVQLAGLLYLGAAIGVLPVALKKSALEARPAMNRTNMWRLAGAILCGGVLGPIAYLAGLKLAAASTVSLWLNLELVATALLGHFIFRDHIGGYGWLGVAGALGAGLLLSSGGGSNLPAAALVAMGCLFWGIDNHLTALIDGITPTQSTIWKGLAAGAFNLVVSVLAGAQWPSPAHIGAALALGAVAYGASITLYISSAQKLGATRAQIVFSSSPFLAALLSTFILREEFGVLHAAAILLLAAAVLLILRDRHAHAHEHSHAAVEHEHSHRHDDGHHEHGHPETLSSKRHSHWHRHAPQSHSHPHWPDLHHRHGHG